MVGVLEVITVVWGSTTAVTVYKTVKDLNEVRPLLQDAEKRLEEVEDLISRHRKAAPNTVYYVPPDADIQKVLEFLEEGHGRLDGELCAYYRQTDEDAAKKNASWLPWHPNIAFTRGHEGRELASRIKSLHWQTKSTSKTIREGNEAGSPQQIKPLLLKALPNPVPVFELQPPGKLFKVLLFPLGGCAPPSTKQKEKWKALKPWTLPNQGEQSNNNESKDESTEDADRTTTSASFPSKSQARSMLPILTTSPLAPSVTTQPVNALVLIRGSASALASLQKETQDSEAIELQNQSHSNNVPTNSSQIPVPSSSPQIPLSSTTSPAPLPSLESSTSP